MKSIYYAQKLIDSLEGRSCMISRINCAEEIERPDNYFTLHQVVYKVLKKSDSGFELSGELMFKFVRLALQEVFKEFPSKEDVLRYYHLIRGHKNSLQELKNLPKGSEVLSHYQRSIAEGMDWEDSLQSASWLLKNGYITSLYQFKFNNIILVQPQLLLQPRNKNSLAFFLALSTWMEDYTRNRIFVVSNQGVVKQFLQGEFKITRNFSDLSV